MDSPLDEDLCLGIWVSQNDIIDISSVQGGSDDLNGDFISICILKGLDIGLHLFIGVPVHWFDNGIRHLLIQKITDPNRCPDSRSHSIGLRIGGLCPVTDKAAQPHGPLSGVPRSRAAQPHIANNQDTAQ